MIRVFGHRAPDMDATGSAIIWAWYLKEIRGIDAGPFVLGKPNAEARFALDRWKVDCPPVLESLAPGDDVVVVDTNNPAELPEGVNDANILAVIDHHLIAGGLRTRWPIEFTVRPVAATATVIAGLMGADLDRAPASIRGIMLSCILSDTLEFRSPTTTEEDRELARRLAEGLSLDVSAYADELFQAKSDISHLSDKELLRLDSKIYDVAEARYRVTVIETTRPAHVLGRKAGMFLRMDEVAAEDGVDQILVFVIDILNEEATLLLPNDAVRGIAGDAFGAATGDDAVVLPGIMSRKKQIVPALLS